MWFKYDRDYLCVKKSQFVPVIFEPPCSNIVSIVWVRVNVFSCSHKACVNVNYLMMVLQDQNRSKCNRGAI